MREEKPRDIVERCKIFVIRIILLIRQLPQTPENREIGKQLIRSAGAMGANYVEAKNARTRAEFFSTAKISLRETAEAGWWLGILEAINEERFRQEIVSLLSEAEELRKIFAAIALKK